MVGDSASIGDFRDIVLRGANVASYKFALAKSLLSMADSGGDGTYDKILAALAADADARELLEWTVSVDSTVARAHQHATNLPRVTGGSVELHESCRRAG